MTRQRPLLFVLIVVAAVVVNAGAADSHEDALVKWLRAKGGVFHSELEIRNVDKMDKNTRLGVFATDDIKEGELLFQIPPDCLVTSVPPRSEGPLRVGDRIEANYLGEGDWYPGEVRAVNTDGTFDVLYDDGDEESSVKETREIQPSEAYPTINDCLTARNLAREMRLGNESVYAPYVNYLLEQRHGQLPSAWSTAGKDLLMNVLGVHSEGQLLPPWNAVHLIELDWYGQCTGNNDPFEENAALLLVQRGWDDVLIPVFDMVSHRNGHWVNTNTSSPRDVYNGGIIEVRAHRDIDAGEELYMSYNFCEDCGNRADSYGSPEILRDYGFVENFPQRWIFHGQEVAFEIDENHSSVSGELELSWFDGAPQEEGIDFLREQLQRLLDIRETRLTSRPNAVPVNEWDVVRDYVQALVVAIGHALRDVSGDVDTCAAGVKVSLVEDHIEYAKEHTKRDATSTFLTFQSS